MRERTDKLSVFPIFMKVEDRFAVVVGDGDEAVAKARLLTESRVAVRIVASRPSLELGVLIIQADLEHVAGPFSPSVLDGTVMVFAATGNADENEAIVRAARDRNIPVNAVDQPGLCDFYTPALVNRAPIAVAIGSEGAGPVLTQMIRARIETLLPRSTGRLARLAARYRATVERLVPRGAARRRFWRAFFEGEVARCVEAGRLAEARRHATRLLKKPDSPAGVVTFVGAGPGAEDLLTLRGQRALMQADVIVHDAGVAEPLVALGRRDARRIAVGEAQGAAPAIAGARAGARIVRLVQGSAAGHREAAEIRAAGLETEIVPGVAADPVTHSATMAA